MVSDSVLDTMPAEGTQADTGARPRTTAIVPGALVGRYVVLARVGAGAMGVVFAAYDPELDRKVALKVLGSRGASSEPARKRLLREAQALAKLDHPNVVRIHDVGVHGGQLFIGMEFVEGRTLGAWVSEAEEPRPWAEVLRVFRAAGRGLAAVHAAGLVHRDFKPDNVMIDGSGRVRVMDFGLVRGSGDEDIARTQEDDEGQGASAFESLRATANALTLEALTRTGAVMGTPAYMPLEQFQRGEVDARSDQFSFCVALYEALYGERPFASASVLQLLTELEAGRARDAPPGSRVPSWVRRAVVRGLAPDPAQRWPSMDALLDTLADDPKSRRRRWLAGGLLSALVLGAGVGLWQIAEQEDQVCAGMDAHLEGVWDGPRREAVRGAIEGTGLSYAGETWERVGDSLDRYAQAWTEARGAACEATQRGEQSPALMDRRMACLDGRLQSLRATVDVLANADAAVVGKAVEAVGELPPLARCADTEALLAELPPPEDEAVAEAVAALDARLREASALEQAGKFEAADAALTEVEEGAKALGYEPLQARAWARRGGLAAGMGDFEASAAAYERAFEASVGLGMREEAAWSARELSVVLGHRLSRRDEGWAWLPVARPLARATGNELTLAKYYNVHGVLARNEADYVDARELFERALAIQRAQLEPDDPDIATTLDHLAGVAFVTGELDEARSLAEQALAIRERVYGPSHPRVGGSLNNLGVVATQAQDDAAARRYFERALAIKRESLGPDHPEVATSLVNLGKLLSDQGDYDAARPLLEEAVVLRERAHGRDHPVVASAQVYLGSCELQAGNYARAREAYEDALAGYEAADALTRPLVGDAHVGLGRALLALGEAELALEHFEEALAMSVASGKAAHVASSRFWVAQALWEASAAPRDRARALELARAAQAGIEDEALRGALERWLEAHG